MKSLFPVAISILGLSAFIYELGEWHEIFDAAVGENYFT